MIHKYRLNGYRIVMDTNSGAVHLFEEAPFLMLDYLEKEDCVPETPPQDMLEALRGQFDEKTLTQAYAELRELYASGQLFSADEYEKFASMMTNAPVKSMCLNIAHDCNLRCEYCFAAKGDFGRGRMLMPLEVAKKAIDFLVEKSGTRHNLEVDFLVESH